MVDGIPFLAIKKMLATSQARRLISVTILGQSLLSEKN